MSFSYIISFLDGTFLNPRETPAKTFAWQFNYYLERLLKGQSPVKSLVYMSYFIIVMVLGIIFWPLVYLLRKTGVVFFTTDFRLFGAIQHVDMLYREKMAFPERNIKIIIIPRPKYVRFNKYMYDAIGRNIVYIDSLLLRILLFPLFCCPIITRERWKFFARRNLVSQADGSLWLEDQDDFYNIWNSYCDQFGNRTITYPEKDVAATEELLAPHVDFNKPWVAVHARDGGFHDDSFRPRNANIHDFEPALHHLIDQGYMVIRIGDNSMCPTDDMAKRLGKNYFDFAKSDLISDQLNTFMLDRAEFLLGTSSGPIAVAPSFDTGICEVNAVHLSIMSTFKDTDIYTFKHVRRKEDGSFIPFKDLLEPPYVLPFSQEILDEHGTYIEDNSPEEILATVKEYLGKLDDFKATPDQEKAKSYLRTGHFCHGTRGHFSEVSLVNYDLS